MTSICEKQSLAEVWLVLMQNNCLYKILSFDEKGIYTAEDYTTKAKHF